MLLKIKNFIKNEGLLPDKRVVLGFSYGMDSRCLLDILLKLNYEVVLVYVNHHVRKESDMEALEVEKLAKKLNLKFYIYDLHLPKENFENNARKLRYSYFNEVALKEGTLQVATAHHLNDNAETIILNILKGSNLYGYSGISSKVYKKNYTIYRPLLCVSKEEIKKYVISENLLYFEDITNTLDSYKRNRIRHHIIPALLDESKDSLNKLLQFSKILQDSFSYIRQNTINFLNQNHMQIDLLSYKGLHKALRIDILCYLFEENHISKNENKLYQIDEMLLSNKPQASFKIKENIYFYKRYSIAYLKKEENIKNEKYYLDLNSKVVISNKVIYFTKKEPSNDAKFIKLCYNDLVFPLIVRGRENGDTVLLKYGHKKLKDIFIDKKIPIEKRNDAIVVLENNEILWVVDYVKSLKASLNKEKGDIYLVCEVK